MLKPFVASNTLLCDWDMVDTQTLGDENQTITRKILIVKAHPGVNAEDILSEVQDIEDSIERGDFLNPLSKRILTTTLSESEEAVIAMTYNGFVEFSKDFTHFLLKRERYAAAAKELIETRDREYA